MLSTVNNSLYIFFQLLKEKYIRPLTANLTNLVKNALRFTVVHFTILLLPLFKV